MDDKMRRVELNDLSTWKNTPVDSSVPSSDGAATRAISSGDHDSESTAVPVCPMCNGAGYYVLDVSVGDPNFGVLMTCECKQREKEQRAASELRRLSNLEPFLDKTFESFNPDVPGVRRAFFRALKYGENPQGWLVFFGNYGSGKTHLAAAIANAALQRHYQVLFAVVPDLLDHLRSTFGPQSDIDYDEQFEMVREVRLLILDDLGTENTTPWAREKLYQIINHRYNYNLPTVITSNRKPEDIEPRIFSRMCDRTLCEEITMIEAGDYRRLSVQQRFGKRLRV